jgi:transglutaminase-like putative cysteine protease
MIERLKAQAPTLGALVLLDLVAAACLGRLFSSPEPLLPILTAVLIGHALAFVCRDKAFSGPLTGAVIAVSAVLLMVWLVAPGTTFLGLPTNDSLRALADGLRDARHQFNVAVAPTKPTDGFTMACVGAVVALAGLADWGAFRIRATIEATIPAFIVFVFAAVLGTTQHRAMATVAFAAALVVWFVTHNATVIARTRPWFNGTSDRGRRALSRAGAGVTALALVGTTLGLAVPFTKDPPAVAWRNKGQSNARTTVSPLVDIRTRLVNRTNVVAFTVSSPVRAYWRLTSLDDFNGRIWSSKGDYGDVKPNKALKDRNGTKVTQQFAIADLKSIWLPVAYRPETTPSLDDISYDDDADAFITANETSDSLVYRVSSAIQDFTPAQLRTSRSVGISNDEVALPAVDPRVRELALQITAGKTTAYDKALAIQNFFRGGAFRYDLNVDPGHSTDDVFRFLFVTRRGYCEQFAGTFAVLARLAGLPTRVAVGFTPGDSDGAGNYTVRELHAHAWPEVFLGSVGWVAFEPTPGRGMPGAQSYTGAVESQADTARPSTPSTAAPTTQVTTPDTQGNNGPTTTVAPNRAKPAAPAGRSWLRIVAIVLGVLALLAGLVAIVPLVVVQRRNRRWSKAADAAERVLVAWNDTNEALRFAGTRVRPSDTPAQRVEAAEPALGGGVAVLERLAGAVDVAAYAPPRLTEDDATAARADAIEVRRLAFNARPRLQRWLYLIDPRRLRG